MENRSPTIPTESNDKDVDLPENSADESSERSLETAEPAEVPKTENEHKSHPVGALLYLIGILILAGLPPFLVFRDRWVGAFSPAQAPPVLWCDLPLICKTGLPDYFLIILVSVILLILLVVLWWRDQGLEKPPDPIAQMDIDVSNAQLRASRYLLISASLLYLFSLLASRRDMVIGWGFGLAIVLYFFSWILKEFSLEYVESFWRDNWRWILSYILAHIALILFIANLASVEQFEWGYGLLFAAALINLSPYIRQIPRILWIQNLAVILYTMNINSWAYSVVGDDFAFFMRAQDIVEKDTLGVSLTNLFDGLGVYGSHPYLSSLIQSLFMRIFGVDSFGWRFSNLYLVTVAVVFIYLFFRCFLSERVALITAVFLAASSYIMTFGKVGYNNLQAFFAMALVLASAGWAVRSRRMLAFVTLGLSLGFCLYVYPAAFYAMPLAVLLLLFYVIPRDRGLFYRWALMVVSFGVLFAPLLYQPDYWSSKVAGLFVNNPEILQSSQTTLEHFGQNLINAFFSFLYIPVESHFVTVGYLDPVTAMFALVGLACSVKWMRKDRLFVFTILGFFLLLALVGASHDRPFPPSTRMFLILPWLALFAALGLDWLVVQFSSLEIVNFSRSAVYSVVLLLVIAMNLIHAYVISPQRSSGAQTVEVLFVKFMDGVMDFERNVPIPKTVLFITDDQWGIDGFYWIQRVYDYPASSLRLERAVIQAPSIQESLGELIEGRNTMVIIQPSMNEEWQEEIRAYLINAGKLPCEIKESTGRDVRFVAWFSPGLEPICTRAQP